MTGFVKGLQAAACAHRDVTPEDGYGYAICVRCGARVVVRLTRRILEERLGMAKEGQRDDS